MKEIIDEKQYFDPSHFGQSYLEKQESFIKTTNKTFYEFKIIEIESEVSVIEHAHFIHPVYNQDIQFIYFDQNLQFMLERLSNQRLFLYQRVNKNNGEIEWEFVKRFNNVPSDLLTQSQFPFVFSPDLMRYVDVDRSRRVFVIRDSKTEDIICDIPQHLLSYTSSSSISIEGSMFRWENNTDMKFFNKEGIEKIVDVSKNFSEIAYNKIPLFDPELYQKRLQHYYFDKPVLSNVDILSLYKRKYQDYKSGFYLENKRDNYGLKLITLRPCIVGVGRMEKYVTQMSFTFLHWRLIEQLEEGKIKIS